MSAIDYGIWHFVVIVVVIHYKLIYISSIIGDVYRYSRLATIQLLVY